MVEPLTKDLENYTSIKRYDLAGDQRLEYTMVFSAETYYRFQMTDGSKSTQYSIVDSDGNILMNNTDEQPTKDLYFQAKKTGIYKLRIDNEGKVLTGQIELAFMRKSVEERTTDGFPKRL